MTVQTGGCQCGRVRYRAETAPSLLVACHCKECQRQSGSAFGMSLVVPASGFTAVGPLKLFERSSEAGNTVRCYLCPDCGTRIYHQPAHATERVNIKAGTLDDTSWLAPQMHVWLRSKQPWTQLDEGIPTHLEQPSFK